MRLRIVRYAAVASTPWKNGLGLTKQLAIHPRSATAESFEWRLSIAQLTGTAPFSCFPGITRCLAVLEGVLALQSEGRMVQRLTAQSPPLQFSGEAAVSGAIEGGPVLDLNLMWQAERWQATMLRLAGTEGVRQLRTLTTGILLLCSLVPQLHLLLGSRQVCVSRYDLLSLDADQSHHVRFPADAFDVYCIELRPR
jgi:environmental stress-induced protein Ves